MSKIYNDIGENWQIGFQEEATPIAAGIVDLHNKTLYYLIIILSIVTYIIIARILSNRSINWLRKRNHSMIIELIWTITPGLILLLIAIPSLKLLYSLDEVIKPNVTLKATGFQWAWNYQINDIDGLDINFESYTKNLEEDLENPLGVSHGVSGELRLLDVDNRVFLPIHTPIRLLVTAQDVIHSWFVPSFGIKIDAIPGRLNHASLFILRPGLFFGSCTELCGAGHERMSIVIEAVETKNYLNWLRTFI